MDSEPVVIALRTRAPLGEAVREAGLLLVAWFVARILAGRGAQAGLV